MTPQIEDILKALCSEVRLHNANDFQKIYALGDMKEAKLAFDVLVAYGFEAKVYHEAGKLSKLYITHPSMAPMQLQQSVAAAHAYAQTLKQIKNSLDSLSKSELPALLHPQYTISFVGTQPNGKQLIVQITPTTKNQLAEAPAPAGEAKPTPRAAAASAPVAQTVRRVRKPKQKDEYEELSAGPAVGKGMFLAADGQQRQDSLRRRTLLYITGNITTSSFAFLGMVVGIGALVSIFIFAKAFLCPDFAIEKHNKEWYCKVFGDPDEERKQQQKQKQQLQRQQQQQP